MAIINGRGRVGIRRPSAVSALILDTYSGAAVAYSLRKLSNTYSGSVIRVRRSSDNTEQNIGFAADGNLDTVALTSFVGAGNGFVTTWYDQGGNGRNLVQTTSTRQPQIVASGVVSTTGIKFDGADDRMATTIGFTQSMPTTTYGVFTIHNSTSYVRQLYWMWGRFALSMNASNRLTLSSSGLAGSNFENSQVAPMTYTLGKENLSTAVYTTTLYKQSLNGGSASGVPSVAVLDAVNTSFYISSYWHDPYGYPKLDIKEVVYFSGDKSSVLPAIVASVNSKYSVYPIVSDVDAQSFVVAAGLTSSVQANAVNTLVASLKSAGIWTKMKAIYPMVGGSAASHKFNLKDPRDLDAAFRLAFTAGWVHSSTGVKPNGTSDYANTFLSANLVESTNHLSYYSRTELVNTECEMGIYISGIPKVFQLRLAANYVTGSGVIPSNGRVLFTTITDARGFWLGSKRSNSDREAYFNGTSQGTSTLIDTTISGAFQYYIGARNDDGAPYLFSTKECAFSSIGDGLTDTEASNFYTAVQTYQTALGRQV